MSDMRGVDPSSERVDVAVTVQGDLFTAVRAFVVPVSTIPGIGPGVAYTAGDAFGIAFTIAVPVDGTIATVTFLDYDDEGKDKELYLSATPFTGTADNAAFAPTDAHLVGCVGIIASFTWYDYSVNQVGISLPSLFYHAPESRLYAQWITRGADNIAAGSIPQFHMVIV